jgi:hypothetical protein
MTTTTARLETWERPKDPDETLDYVFDFTEELDTGDAIASYTLLVERGHCTVSSSSNDDETVTAWFADGEAGEACEIRCRAVTDALRTIDRTGRLLIRRR